MHPQAKSHRAGGFSWALSDADDVPFQEKEFIVSVHDVEPRFQQELTAVVDALQPRVGKAMSAAVVAEPTEKFGSPDFQSLVKENFTEIALHGFSHQSRLRWDPISLLTNRANEFSWMPQSQAKVRLHLGQEALNRSLGAPASVFIPPAWCLGAITIQTAADAGLSAIVTLRRLLTREGRIPLAISSWDCGRMALLGYAGEWFGRVRSGIPCVTFHPADVRRGFLTRGIRMLDRLLERGFQPTTFAQLATRRKDPANLLSA